MSLTTGPETGGYPARSGVWRGFAVQGRVIHALILREIQTRFGRNGLGFLWLFIEPLLLAAVVAVLHWIMYRGDRLPGVPVFLFYLIGYVPYFAFRSIVGRAPAAFQANQTLLFHRQVRFMDVVVARHVLEALAVLTVILIIVIGTVMIMGRMPHSIPHLFGGIILMILYANGLGMIAAAAAGISETAERMVTPLVYFSLPLSGAFFTLHSMPRWVRDILIWNPQVNMHEMIREGMYGHITPTYYDVPYVIVAVAVVNLLGMMAMRAVRPQLEF